MASRLLFASLALIACAATGQASAVELQPHRAFYDLRLESAKPASGITALSGRLALEWADACEGYTLTQRMGFRVVKTGAGEMASDLYIATWESRDGTVLRYNIRNTVNGKVVEEFSGRARLEAPGKGGVATFTKPRPMTVELPPGTVFPSEHTRLLVEHALAGERRVARTVFEGMDGDSLRQAFAFLGTARAPETEGQRHELLRGLTSWPVRIAFFPVGGGGDVPDYEIGLRLFANGVGDEVRLDYGEFTVGGRLTRLEALPDSGC